MANKPWQNKSGCPDPTAYEGEKAITEEEQRVAELVWIFKKITPAGQVWKSSTELSSGIAGADELTDRRFNEQTTIQLVAICKKCDSGISGTEAGI